MRLNIKKKFLCILGNPRSGTSLLRIMLNSHRYISIPPECGFYHWLSLKYNEFDFNFLHSWIDQYLIDLKGCKKIETWNLNFKDLKIYITNFKPTDYASLSNSVYSFFAITNNKNPKILGDKNNYYINHISELEKINNQSRYLLIIRDCRDVVHSYLKLKHLETNSPYKPKLSTNIEEIAKEWTTNNSIALSFFSTITKKRYKIVKFEDLIRKNKCTLYDICKWLQISYDDQMEEYYTHNKINNIEPLLTLDWKMDTLKKPLIEKIGQYKNSLTNDEICRINVISKEILTKYEYI